MEVQDPAVEAQQAPVDPPLLDLPLVHGVHVSKRFSGGGSSPSAGVFVPTLSSSMI